MSEKAKLGVQRKQRPIATREQILVAARELGVQNGWKAVTIRSIAAELGYAHPLLYEHFRDKEDVLSHLASEGLRTLEAFLVEGLPDDPLDAVLVMAEHYWTFMLENTQMYRLMNGMDGIAIDHSSTREAALRLCMQISEAIRRVVGKKTGKKEIAALTDETWALLHGMATLYLDRGAPFDMERVRSATMRFLTGTSALYPPAACKIPRGQQ